MLKCSLSKDNAKSKAEEISKLHDEIIKDRIYEKDSDCP